MRQYFPDLTDQDLQTATTTGGNKWTNMIQWARQHLVYRGCIDNSVHGKWALSDTGRQFLLANWRGPDADYSGVKKPPIVKPMPPKPNTQNGQKSARKKTNQFGSTSVSLGAGTTQSAPGASQQGVGGQPTLVLPTPTQLVIRSPAEELSQRLQAAQRLSNTPQQFEQALTDAFTFLGFNTKHI